jgi:hypothetical protein
LTHNGKSRIVRIRKRKFLSNQIKQIKAIESVGCEAGEALDFEAKLMVEDLQQIKASIRAVDEYIRYLSWLSGV